MPVLGHALREVSTDSRVPEPGIYTAQIIEVEDTKSRNNKDMTVITYKIVGGDYDGYELKDYLVTEGKTPGTYNKSGLRGLKRLGLALVGDRATADNFDTAELQDLTCSILVKSDSYEDQDLKAAGIDEKVQTAKIKRVLGPA